MGYYNGMVWITEMSAKMEKIPSFSTSCKCNEHCMKYREIEGSICEECYANAVLDYRESLAEHLEENFNTLNLRILESYELPHFNPLVTPYIRGESHGDFASVNAVINAINICNENPKSQIAVWTKNPFLFKQAFDMGYEKPENMRIVVSSLFRNVVRDVSVYDFVDVVFTVYDMDFALEHDIKINCGTRHCINCGICYQKSNNGIIYVNEILKKESKRYYKELEKRNAHRG